MSFLFLNIPNWLNLFTEDQNKLPLLVEYPHNLTLKPGDTARFSCKTFDQLYTKVDWYFLNGTNPRDIETEDLLLFKKMVNNHNVRLLLMYYLKNY